MPLGEHKHLFLLTVHPGVGATGPEVIQMFNSGRFCQFSKAAVAMYTPNRNVRKFKIMYLSF